jgi:hypothetical protein
VFVGSRRRTSYYFQGSELFVVVSVRLSKHFSRLHSRPVAGVSQRKFEVMSTSLSSSIGSPSLQSRESEGVLSANIYAHATMFKVVFEQLLISGIGEKELSQAAAISSTQNPSCQKEQVVASASRSMAFVTNSFHAMILLSLPRGTAVPPSLHG